MTFMLNIYETTLDKVLKQSVGCEIANEIISGKVKVQICFLKQIFKKSKDLYCLKMPKKNHKKGKNYQKSFRKSFLKNFPE